MPESGPGALHLRPGGALPPEWDMHCLQPRRHTWPSDRRCASAVFARRLPLPYHIWCAPPPPPPPPSCCAVRGVLCLRLWRCHRVRRPAAAAQLQHQLLRREQRHAERPRARLVQQAARTLAMARFRATHFRPLTRGPVAGRCAGSLRSTGRRIRTRHIRCRSGPVASRLRTWSRPGC